MLCCKQPFYTVIHICGRVNVILFQNGITRTVHILCPTLFGPFSNPSYLLCHISVKTIVVLQNIVLYYPPPLSCNASYFLVLKLYAWFHITFLLMIHQNVLHTKQFKGNTQIKIHQILSTILPQYYCYNIWKKKIIQKKPRCFSHFIAFMLSLLTFLEYNKDYMY